jgi:hypothetical protein
VDETFTSTTNEKPYWKEGVFVRNNVIITISVDHAHALNHVSDIEHFESRLLFNAGFVFGLDFLATHKDFDRSSTDCLEQVPYSSPYFTIKSVSTIRNRNGPSDYGVSWKLNLEPTTPFTIFKQFVMNLQHDPVTEREVNRRKAANEDVGVDVRTGRRLALTLSQNLADWNMNYDATTKKAKQSKFEFISASPGAATCTECYAYATGKLVANVKLCIDIFVSATANYRYDTTTKVADFTKSGVALTALPDCVALGTIGSATSSVFGSTGYSSPSSNNAMFGLEAEAYVEGGIGANFQFSSQGISAATTTVTDADILKDTLLSPIVIYIQGFPLSITPTIGLFVKKFAADGKVTGSLEFGAGFDATAKLGGKISFPSFFKATPQLVGVTGIDPAAINTPTWTSYKDFTMKTSVLPFKMTKFSASVNVNMWLLPKIILSIYGALPINILPVIKSDVTLKTSARRLEKKGDEEGSTSPTSSYETSSLRRLQTCATGATSYGVNGGVELTLGVDAAQAGALINGVFKAFTPNPLDAITGATTLIGGVTSVVVPKTDILPGTAVVPQFALITPGCTDATGAVVIGPSATPSPSPSKGAVIGAAGGGGGGGSSDGSKSAAGALDGGAIAGIVIGSLVLISSLGIWYYLAFVAPGPIRCLCVVCLPIHPNPNANVDHSIQKIDPTAPNHAVLAIRNAATTAVTATTNALHKAGSAAHNATHRGAAASATPAAAPAAEPAPAPAAEPAPAPAAAPAAAPTSAPAPKKGPPPKKGMTEAEKKAADEEDAKKRAKKDFDEDHLPPGWDWEESDEGVYYHMPNGETTVSTRTGISLVLVLALSLPMQPLLSTPSD